MEKRKEIVEKLIFDMGVKEGIRTMGEVLAMRREWHEITEYYEEKKVVDSTKKKEEIEDSLGKLKNLFACEMSDHAPKRIKDYFDKVNCSVIDNAITTFSSALRKITVEKEEEDVLVDEVEGLVKIYNKERKKAIELSITFMPKGIESYCSRIVDKHHSIFDIIRNEEFTKHLDIYNKSVIAILDPIADKLMNDAHFASRARVEKQINKLISKVAENKYNLRNKMTDEELDYFIMECFKIHFCKGCDSVYNKDLIKDIFPFNLKSAPHADLKKAFSMELSELSLKKRIKSPLSSNAL